MEPIIVNAGLCLNFFLEYAFEDSSPEERMGKRMVYIFSNGIHVSFLGNGHFSCYRLDRPDVEEPAAQDWSWDFGAAAWISKQTFEVTDVADVVDKFVKKWGKANLVLPWEELIGGQLGDLDSFQDSYPDDVDIEAWETYRDSFDAIKTAITGNFKSEILSAVEFTSGNALLPSQSKYVRFCGFLEALVSKGWIICDGYSDRDSALKDVESMRNANQRSKNAPALIGYSDINNPSFMPSGDFQSISYWVQSSKGSEDLYIAKDFNLEIELAEESFTIL